MQILLPPAAAAYTANHPVISIVIPIVLPNLIAVLLPLATLVNWTWAIVLLTALRLAASWNWTVANCALPIVPLLVPFVDWNRFRNGPGFRSVRFLACRYWAAPGRLLNCRRRKGTQSDLETFFTAFALRLLSASKKGRKGNSALSSFSSCSFLFLLLLILWEVERERVVFWGELGNIWRRGGLGGSWHISFLSWREF